MPCSFYPYNRLSAALEPAVDIAIVPCLRLLYVPSKLSKEVYIQV